MPGCLFVLFLFLNMCSGEQGQIVMPKGKQFADQARFTVLGCVSSLGLAALLLLVCKFWAQEIFPPQPAQRWHCMPRAWFPI